VILSDLWLAGMSEDGASRDPTLAAAGFVLARLVFPFFGPVKARHRASWTGQAIAIAALQGASGQHRRRWNEFVIIRHGLTNL
jgi:hypothetical protein